MMCLDNRVRVGRRMTLAWDDFGSRGRDKNMLLSYRSKSYVAKLSLVT